MHDMWLILNFDERTGMLIHFGDADARSFRETLLWRKSGNGIPEA